MRYSFTTRRNRRLYLAWGVVALLILVAVIPLSLAPGPLTVLVSLVCGYLAYQIIKFLRSHLTSYILTHDDGVTLRFPDTSVQRLAWDDITHAGHITTPEGKLIRFIYAEKMDRLATVPAEYDDLEKLDEELKGRCDWYELTQEAGQSLGQTVLPYTSHAVVTDDSPAETSED